MVYIPYFDGDVEVVELEATGEVSASNVAGSSALNAFLALTPTDRVSDTRHVYAYYQDIEKMAAEVDGFDLEMTAPNTPEAIWAHVVPTEIYLEAGRRGDPHFYVVASCECDWEIEHGLMMVWRDGTTLCKVSPYDGHITNANALNDASLRDVVYPGFDETFRTYAAS
jgi:hypothetical protein